MTEKEKRHHGFPGESLGLKGRELISLVGAGGKTTLMFRLASDLSSEGKKVVTTTTTKILEPSPEESPLLIVHGDEATLKQSVISRLSQCRHMTIASERLGEGKLKGISTSLVDELWGLDEVDYLIVEADGASGRPIKAPREKEPVIPSATTLVVAILGVDGEGKELNATNAFQPERISRITGIPIGEKVTDEAMAVLMTDPEGIVKGVPPAARVIVFLNKVDLRDGLVKGRRIGQKIIERRRPQIERIILGQLRTQPAVAEVIFP